jgi:(p)ppGpp synthase/HD superfamily hydrolase
LIVFSLIGRFRACRDRNTYLGERFEFALAYANQAHREQKRKGTAVPYVSHLPGVASIAIELGADENQAIAALLHDAVEDQGGSDRLRDIEHKFGEDVASIVADCTDGEPDGDRSDPNLWRARKEAYIAMLANKPPRSLLVCLADKTHNARSIHDDLAVLGPTILERFNGGLEGTLWYYRTLADTLSDLLPDAGSQRLRTVVSEMHRLAATSH